MRYCFFCLLMMITISEGISQQMFSSIYVAGGVSDKYYFRKFRNSTPCLCDTEYLPSTRYLNIPNINFSLNLKHNLKEKNFSLFTDLQFSFDRIKSDYDVDILLALDTNRKYPPTYRRYSYFKAALPIILNYDLKLFEAGLGIMLQLFYYENYKARIHILGTFQRNRRAFLPDEGPFVILQIAKRELFPKIPIGVESNFILKSKNTFEVGVGVNYLLKKKE